MPDFNKGDFTQQGVAGHVNANLRLNEKRLVNIDMTSNEEAEGCTITGTVTDLLNNEVYPIGAGVSGNIEITENGENINVAPYATATVNVSGGSIPLCTITIVNNHTNEVAITSTIKSAFSDGSVLYEYYENILYENDYIYNAIYTTDEQGTFIEIQTDTYVISASNAVNCSYSDGIIDIIDKTINSSITLTVTSGGIV